MPTFTQRLQAVIGSEASHSWATRHDLPAPKIWDWVKNERTPRRPQLVELAEKTGIPLEWWMDGELPPPPAKTDYPLGGEGVSMRVEERRASFLTQSSKINVEALAAILEGALKTAPTATPQAIAAHCAKVYAQAIEDGLITPDGLGPAGAIHDAA